MLAMFFIDNQSKKHCVHKNNSISFQENFGEKLAQNPKIVIITLGPCRYSYQFDKSFGRCNDTIQRKKAFLVYLQTAEQNGEQRLHFFIFFAMINAMIKIKKIAKMDLR
jgi:hypothetical protein